MSTIPKKEPICVFRSQEELDQCLKWWKKRLYLNDWFISATILPMSDFNIEDSVGENISVYENKCTVIHLSNPESYPSGAMLRFCHEKTLVHELLHCKYCYMAPPETYEGKTLELLEHQHLEEMARSLLMVKYGVDPDWFKNS